MPKKVLTKAEEIEAKPEKDTFRNTFKGSLNIPVDQKRKQMRSTMRRILPQVMMHPPNDYKVALLCGGPSLNDAKIIRGYKIACVNNTYSWALAKGLKPSVYVQHDAREVNASFVSEPLDTCKYLLNTQVHPAMFDALEGYDVRVWHSGGDSADSVLNKYYMGRWLRIPGGTTIGTRAIFLLYTLGVRVIRVYGMDSSYAKGQHHAYAQPGNDKDAPVAVKVGRRKFRSTPWMVSQLDEMLQLAARFPPDLKIAFEGDGLLQYVIKETNRRGKVPSMIMEPVDGT